MSLRAAFARMLYAACIAGLVSGLILTALQSVAVIPIIHEAETYEPAEPAASAGSTHVHTDGSQYEAARGTGRLTARV